MVFHSLWLSYRTIKTFLTSIHNNMQIKSKALMQKVHENMFKIFSHNLPQGVFVVHRHQIEIIRRQSRGDIIGFTPVKHS